MTSLLGRSSGRHLIRHPWLFGLSVLGVAVAVAVVVGIDLANASARRAFELSVEGVAGRATHEIVGGPTGIDERLYSRLRIEHGMHSSTPVVQETVAAADGSGRTFQLLGIDIFVDDTLRSFSPSFAIGGDSNLAGASAFLTRPNTLFLGSELANDLGLGVGDELPIRAAGTTQQLEIIGLLSPSDDLARQALRDLLIVDLATAQEIADRPGRLDRIDLILPPGSGASGLAEVLPPGIELQAKSARSDSLDQMTRAFRLNLSALSLLALVVGMFLIFNSMTFSVVQRRGLFGTLRALGVTRRQIFGLIVAEALVVGLVGSLLGLVLGVVLAQGLLGLVIQTINDLYFVLSVENVDLPWLGLAKGLALGIFGTLLATLRPASEATRATPRNVQSRSLFERQTRSQLSRGAVLGFAAMLATVGLLALPTKNLTLSFTALFLFVLGFAALVPVATLAASHLSRAPMRRFFGSLGSMAARGIGTTLSRTGIAVAALVIAVSVTIGVGIMVTSFRSTLIDWLDVTLQADIYVAPADPRSRGGASHLDRSVLATIEQDPDVELATTYRRVRVSSAEGEVHLGALQAERPAFAVYDFAKGDADEIWQRFQHQEAVIVSESLAYHRNLDVGSTIELLSDRGMRSFEVAGIYYDYGSDRGVVTLSRATYDRYWDDPEIFSIGIYARQGAALEPLIERLRSQVGERDDVRWIANRDLREASLEIFDRTFVITDVLRLLATAIAFIGVLSALMALQLERGREFGVLRANGLTPGQLWGLVTAQCSLTGLIAGLLAVPLGGALAVLLIHIINRRSFGWTLRMELEPQILLQAILLAVVAAVLAGVYPAYKSSKASPALALREE